MRSEADVVAGFARRRVLHPAARAVRSLALKTGLPTRTLSALATMAAIVAGVATLLAGWLVLSPADASGGAESPRAERAPDCLLGVNAAALRFRTASLRALRGGGVSLRAVAPARFDAPQLTVPVRGASGVPCRPTTGVISMRGGLDLRGGGERRVLRRWRLDVDQKRIDVVLTPGGDELRGAFEVDLARAERVVIGDDLTLRTDLRLGEGGAEMLGDVFGMELDPGVPLARLVLAAREVEADAEPAEDDA